MTNMKLGRLAYPIWGIYDRIAVINMTWLYSADQYGRPASVGQVWHSFKSADATLGLSGQSLLEW